MKITINARGCLVEVEAIGTTYDDLLKASALAYETWELTFKIPDRDSPPEGSPGPALGYQAEKTQRPTGRAWMRYGEQPAVDA